MIIGRVDEVDGHFVATRFLLGLIPVDCVYVAKPGTRTTAAGKERGIRIQTSWRSVVMAYGRVWLPALALAIPLGLAYAGSVPPVAWIGSGLMLTASGLCYRAGRLPDEVKARLRVLGTVTGLRIDPVQLLPALRDVKRESLRDLMDKGGIPTTPEGILSVIDDIPLPAMPLVYGYCRYAGDDEVWSECAEHVFARHEAGDI